MQFDYSFRFIFQHEANHKKSSFYIYSAQLFKSVQLLLSFLFFFSTINFRKHTLRYVPCYTKMLILIKMRLTNLNSMFYLPEKAPIDEKKNHQEKLMIRMTK